MAKPIPWSWDQNERWAAAHQRRLDDEAAAVGNEALAEELRHTPVFAPEPTPLGECVCVHQFGSKTCARPAGHKGHHMSPSGSSWPR